jgi:hypothetical protein
MRGRIGWIEGVKIQQHEKILRERSVEQQNSVPCGLDQQIADIKNAVFLSDPVAKTLPHPFLKHSILFCMLADQQSLETE